MILSDNNILGMIGLELLEHLKQKYRKPQPTVMMTNAYNDEENLNIAKRLDKDDL